MEKWANKTAVVTGASAGIGAQILKDFAKNGINVVGLARRPERIEQIAAELGETSGKIYARKCDITDLQSIKETFKWIGEEFGGLHILVNNAGIGYSKEILQVELKDEEDKDYDNTIKTNFNGVVHITRHAFPLMSKADDYGMIINIGSVAGYNVTYFKEATKANVYNGTKFAVRATTEILRHELINMKNSKIRVSSVSPGIVDTDFFHSGKFLPEDLKMANLMPSLTSEDVSNAVLFLLTTPYHVNVTEMIVKPVGETF